MSQIFILLLKITFYIVFILLVAQGHGDSQYPKVFCDDFMQDTHNATIPGQNELDPTNFAVIQEYMAYWESQNGNFLKSLQEYQNALELYQDRNLTDQIEKTYYNIGFVQSKLYRYRDAIISYKKSANISKQIGNMESLNDSYIEMARNFKFLEEYDSSLYYHGLNLILVKNYLPNDKIRLFNVYNAYGIAYNRIKDFERAETYYFKALKMAKNLGDSKRISIIYTNLGYTYRYQGNFDKAIQYSEMAMKILHDQATTEDLQDILINVIAIYVEKKDFTKAQHYIDQINMLAAEGKNELNMRDQIDVLAYKSHVQNANGVPLMAQQTNKKAQSIQQFIAQQNQSNTSQTDPSALLGSKGLSLNMFPFGESYNLMLLFVILIVCALVVLLYFRVQKYRLQLIKTELEKENLQAKYDKGVESIQHASHDLKNPTNNIKGVVKLLLKQGKNLDDKQFKMLRMIDQTAERMHQLVVDELDNHAQASRADQEEMHSLKQSETINLGEMIKSLVEVFQGSSLQKAIKIHTGDTLACTYNLQTDRAKLTRIFENLLSNALKFTPSGKNIYVEAKNSADTDEIITEIRDEGVGIHHNEQPRLFERFTKLSAKPTAGEDSSGLGLSIAYQLTHELGGRIWCESQVGKGTSFYVAIPRS